DAADADRAASPGHGSLVVVPEGAGHDVVAVAQDRDAAVAHGVGLGYAGRGADKAIVGGDDAADPGRPASPGHGSRAAVPEEPSHDVVAVAQDRDAAVSREAAHHVAAGGADEAIGCGDDAADPRGAASPGHGSLSAVPEGAGHDVVAVAQGRDAAV